MNTSLRNLVGRFALGVFLASVVVPVTPASHLIRDADIECGGPGLQVGRAYQQFEPVGGPAGPEHCPACHLMRALGGADPTQVASAVPGPSAPELHLLPLDSRHDRTVVRERPSRAPPVALSA